MSTARKTILVVGKKESGKTALLERLRHDRFPLVHTATESNVPQDISLSGDLYSFVEVPENIHEHINTKKIIGDPDVVLLLFDSRDTTLNDQSIIFNDQLKYLTSARDHLKIRWMERLQSSLTVSPEPKFILIYTRFDQNCLSLKDLSEIEFFVLGAGLKPKNHILSYSAKLQNGAKLQHDLVHVINEQELESKLAREAEEKYQAKLEAEAKQIAMWRASQSLLQVQQRRVVMEVKEIKEVKEQKTEETEETVKNLFDKAIGKLPVNATEFRKAIETLCTKTLDNISSGKFSKNEGKELARQTNILILNLRSNNLKTQLDGIKTYRKVTYPYKKCKNIFRIIGLVVGLAIGFVWGIHAVNFYDAQDLITHIAKIGKFLGCETLTLCSSSVLVEVGIWRCRNKEATEVANQAAVYHYKRQIGEMP